MRCGGSRSRRAWFCKGYRGCLGDWLRCSCLLSGQPQVEEITPTLHISVAGSTVVPKVRRAVPQLLCLLQLPLPGSLCSQWRTAAVTHTWGMGSTGTSPTHSGIILLNHLFANILIPHRPAHDDVPWSLPESRREPEGATKRQLHSTSRL